MPFLIENVTKVVLALFVLASLGNLFLVGAVFLRRRRRQKYFSRVDALRERYGPIIAGTISGSIAYRNGLDALRQISGTDRLFMLERLCLEKRPAPEEVSLTRRLCEDLGLVKIWQQRLMGQIDQASLREALINPQGLLRRVKFLRFLIRSKSAENLGLIRHEPSWPLLVKALEDPNPDIQMVAVRALAAIHHPGSFLPLVEQLHKAVLEPAPSLSVRTVKTALVNFSLDCARELRLSLRNPNPRIRFLATDIIREMVEREASGQAGFQLDKTNFDDETAGIFLSDLPFDGNPDVRARAAAVIACLADPRAASTLFTLLEDSAWFVRLHAVRSLGRHRFLSAGDRIARVLTDPNWRVREAAVRALRGFGRPGLKLLTSHFLATRDRYSREQVADEFQRAGLVPELMTSGFETGNGRETAVLRNMVEMGKTSYMISVLEEGEGNGKLRKSFLRQFGTSPDPQIQQWVERLAVKEPDFDVRSLAQEALATTSRHGEG
ncbi:MAG TPA: HEAT repeat domain-containing protein [Terriglobia bacterium]|nr:HEAT repeat domain-containing protein [Terriglobia bacterium]